MPGSSGYNEHPTENEKIHCLIILMDALTVTGMDKEVEKKIKAIREEANTRRKGVKGFYSSLQNCIVDLNPLFILTKIDSLCEDTEAKTSNVYRSKLIRDNVKNVFL